MIVAFRDQGAEDIFNGVESRAATKACPKTLWSIAHRYHVTIAELKRWNHLDGVDIRPGEALRVGSQP